MKKYQQMIQQIYCILFFLVIVFAAKTFWDALPEKIYVNMGQAVSYDFGVPVSVVLKEDSTQVFDNLAGAFAGGKEERPSYTVTCRLFGIFPVKDVEVVLVEPEMVYASGMPIGIYARTDGVLIIGTGEVESGRGETLKPAENLVKSGDYIISINGESVDEKEDLIEKINEYGSQKEILGIIRNEEYIEVAMNPVKNENGNYMLGIWVRDDLAGVGTLTYYTDDGTYGALGHAISDGDTGTMMNMSEGYVYHTNIIGIRRGTDGSPGELSGVIEYSRANRLGSITKNTALGIHGILDGNLSLLEPANSYEIVFKQDIQKGEAYILSSISGKSKRYKIMIENLDYSGAEKNKGILFRVTDPELLSLTGGIVQGMSGSPILQNNRIVGAVTHVFVSDASMGYGIFIEKMVEQD